MSGGFLDNLGASFAQNMGDHFSHDFDAEGTLSAHLREHGDAVGRHGQTLSANTERRVGHGPVGEVLETGVKRITGAFAEDFSGAFKGFLHRMADIAEHNTKTLQGTEQQIKARHELIQPHGGLWAQVQGLIGGDLHTDPGGHDVMVGSKTAGEIEADLAAAMKDPKTSHMYENYNPIPEGLWTLLQKHRKAGGWDWPKNEGAVEGTSHEQTLAAGTLLSRFGSDHGHYGSPVDTPVDQRSLPPDSATGKHTLWQVVKPIEVTTATVDEAFGQGGWGVQHKTKESFAKLAKEHLKKVG